MVIYIVQWKVVYDGETNYKVRREYFYTLIITKCVNSSKYRKMSFLYYFNKFQVPSQLNFINYIAWVQILSFLCSWFLACSSLLSLLYSAIVCCTNTFRFGLVICTCLSKAEFSCFLDQKVTYWHKTHLLPVFLLIPCRSIVIQHTRHKMASLTKV